MLKFIQWHPIIWFNFPWKKDLASGKSDFNNLLAMLAGDPKGQFLKTLHVIPPGTTRGNTSCMLPLQRIGVRSHLSVSFICINPFVCLWCCSWVGYEKEGFRGHQYLLEEGDYQDWRVWGGRDAELRSVRLIRAVSYS